MLSSSVKTLSDKQKCKMKNNLKNQITGQIYQYTYSQIYNYIQSSLLILLWLQKVILQISMVKTFNYEKYLLNLISEDL